MTKRPALLVRLVAILLLVTAALTPSGAFAAERVALVFGMANYQSISSLRNTASDARDISNVLEKLGFEVTVAINQPLKDMVATINDFSFRAETADIALVYYAGHGVEIAGQNYLIPVDIAIDRPDLIGERAVSVKKLLGAVDRARKLRIVILDSCRNNPFENLPVRETTTPVDTENLVAGIRSGLAAPDAKKGVLVVYAAKEGEVALDGKGRNSPFAAALIESLPEPDVEIGLVFRTVRDRVMQLTANRQQPHFYGSLSGVPFFLAGSGAKPAATAQKQEAWATLAADQAVQLSALAEEGNTRAMIGLGYMSLSPDKNRYSPEKAFELFSKAAAAGDPEAQFELGKLYERGIGVKQDTAQAITLYKQSAERGFADAINDLGFLYYQGAEGLPRDPARAIALFEEAADLRHPQAMFNVAALIDDGTIKGRTPSDAAAYLYLALRSGVEDVLQQLTENPAMFSAPTRRALQEELARNNFYAGAIDGNIGSGTQRSMRIAFGREE